MISNAAIGTIHTVVYFSLTPLRDQEAISAKRVLAVRGTYVSHGSTRATPSLSILLIHCSRKTMLQFLYVVPPKRSCGLSTDQEERASVEHPVAVDHLQDTVSLRLLVTTSRGKTTNVLSCSSRLRFGEEQLRTQVSTVDTCFVRDTYPNLAEYYPLTPFHLEGTVLRKVFENYHVTISHLPHKTVDHTQGLCNSYPSLVLG
jgi:hypothetical protein